MKILLIEDDPFISQLISTKLIANRYTVDLVTDGELGLEFALMGKYSLILLDVIIPILDGLSLCHQLRDSGCETPIIMLTAKNSDEDVITGLDAGADDYVTKPFDVEQLLARIRALIRRQDIKRFPSILTWGALQFDPILIKVTYQDQVINLSPKEYSILELFLRHPQRIFSRSDIIDRLWMIDESPTEAAVTNLIKDLRRKLTAAGMKEELIETIYKLGYRLKSAPDCQEKKKQEQEGLMLLEQVKQDFKKSLKDRIKGLEKVSIGGNCFSPSQRIQLKQEAHRLAGGLGIFGYSKGSEVAKEIEHLLDDESGQEEENFILFSQLITELKQEIGQSVLTSNLAPLSRGFRPLIVIIDEYNPFTQAIQEAAPDQGINIEIISDEIIPWQWLKQNTPDVIMLSLHRSLTQDSGLMLLQQLKKQFPSIPVLVTTEKDNLYERVAVVRSGGEGYILQTATTEEVFGAITEVLSPVSICNSKVMIVDDDPIFLKTLMALLQPWELQVTTLSKSDRFWQVLTTTNPDVLLLDLEMPTFNGLELCRVVRQDSKYNHLPIVVVTAHTDDNSIQQVFAAGADDFISKPITDSEVLARVINQIERSR
ncbi:multi-component transcriptional regulator, winged helix family [Gloeothece citriformis PCC 7424]|uniref:Multi-component transcriptional regulator, winged helix family n=1 Tax=Gloeothece citriformis (strain PCC 7424) TaxID=65393 RepID=B7KB48_GLOC7|nr:response regulator [Gloeothece citriformis]ACK70158.1 multi-component transcriptional regulator, winged helix family [Gloeothece citriformis PCC 7424]